MQSAEIRQKFLAFFEKRGHAIIPSASLVPENDPSVLFTTAGMQPLVPYLLGEEHPLGKRLVNVQKCVRTQDIDEVGDNTHDTFFEMLGNWSLGDYFKEESIKWSFELLTDKEEGFGLDPKRLYITCFGGNVDAPQDIESFEIWKKYMPENRIYFLTWNGKKEPNWWDAGANGPAGPDTEIFYDLTGTLGEMTKEEYLAADERQDVVEIWNNVFMEYLKKDGKVVGKLAKKNVDTGAGLERWAMMLQGKDNIFETDLFAQMMPVAGRLAGDLKSQRIIADHFRTAVFMIADGVIPSNTDQGYVLRRLLRRALIKTKNRKLDSGEISLLVNGVSDTYAQVYPNIQNKIGVVKQIIEGELTKFEKTIDEGMKEFKKTFQGPATDWVPDSISEEEMSKILLERVKSMPKTIPGFVAFRLQSTFGFPIELSQEIAAEQGKEIDMEGYQAEMQKHQEVSKAGSEQKFKGGLAGHSDMEVKYHTATHLLHQALHDVLGDEVGQKGSNITPERLRFDFSFPRKLTEEEKNKVEAIVNEKIQAALPVTKAIMPKAEAEKTGARMFFGEKYPDEVSVYYIGTTLADAYSKEFCGGPHVENTSVLGHFKIVKEEAVAASVRRIKAVLE